MKRKQTDAFTYLLNELFKTPFFDVPLACEHNRLTSGDRSKLTHHEQTHDHY